MSEEDGHVLGGMKGKMAVAPVYTLRVNRVAETTILNRGLRLRWAINFTPWPL